MDKKEIENMINQMPGIMNKILKKNGSLTRIKELTDYEKECFTEALKLAEEKHKKDIEKISKVFFKKSFEKDEKISRLKQDILDAFREGKKQGKYKERQAMIARIDKTIQRLLDNPPKRVGVSVIQANGWMGFAVSLREELKKGGEQNE